MFETFQNLLNMDAKNCDASGGTGPWLAKACACSSLPPLTDLLLFWFSILLALIRPTIQQLSFEIPPARERPAHVNVYALLYLQHLRGLICFLCPCSMLLAKYLESKKLNSNTMWISRKWFIDQMLSSFRIILIKLS